jgi:hypothetical protein
MSVRCPHFGRALSRWEHNGEAESPEPRGSGFITIEVVR